MLESDTYAAFNSYRTMLQMIQIDGVKVNDGRMLASKKPRRYLCNKDLEIEEKVAIQKYIESLPENTDDSHPLYFENNDYIYIFNTLLSRYEENIVDGDGFEILRKIDLNNISNEEQREIDRIADKNLQSFDKNIGEFRNEQKVNHSSGNNSAKATAAVQTDGVDIGTGENSQADRGRDTGAGNDNRGNGGINTPEGTILFSRRKGAESIKINRIKYPSILGTFLPHCFVKFQ